MKNLKVNTQNYIIKIRSIKLIPAGILNFGGNRTNKNRRRRFVTCKVVCRALPLQVVADTDKQYQWVPKDFWISTLCTVYVKGFFHRYQDSLILKKFSFFFLSFLMDFTENCILVIYMVNLSMFWIKLT